MINPPRASCSCGLLSATERRSIRRVARSGEPGLTRSGEPELARRRAGARPQWRAGRIRMSTINRRHFVSRGAALGAIGLTAPATLSRAQTSDGGAAQPLPARGEFVIRNAYVMTMDPSLGDIAGGD